MTPIINEVLSILGEAKAEECPLDAEQATKLISSVNTMSKRIARLEKIVITAFAAIFITTVGIDAAPKSVSALEKLQVANKSYCGEENEHVRQLLINAIRVEFPLYPEGGLCGSAKMINNIAETLRGR